MGPLLFSIFINEITKLIINGLIILFADDITLVVKSKKLSELENKVNSDLNLINEWLKQNDLIINESKSQYMTFGTNNTINLKLNDVIIPEVKELKILGVIFDNRLSFEKHIDSLSLKTSRMTGIIKRVRYLLPDFSLILLYKSLIESNLRYFCTIWRFTYESHINQLFKQQRIIAKIISTSNILPKDIIDIHRLINYNAGLFIYKALNGFLPIKMCNAFNYEKKSKTRSNDNFSVTLPFCKYNYTQNSILYKGVKCFNNIPFNIRQIDKLISFKKSFFTYLNE